MKRLSVLLCVLFVFTVFIGTASALTIGNDIIDRPEIDGATNIAFIDPSLVFETAGTLDSWDIWLSADPGDVWAQQIYRYTGEDFSWRLVYSYTYTYTSFNGDFDGKMTISAESPFDIQAGDVVGWWFGGGGGTIPFTYTGVDDVEWTNYLAATTAISAPEVGKAYNFNTEDWARSSQKREYSIAANYSPVPEPATMMLLGIGLVGLAWANRNKFFKN